MADHRPDIYREGDKWIFRASVLASCPRRLVAAALGHEPLDFPDVMTRGMQEGADNEERVLSMFREGRGIEGEWASRYKGLELPAWKGLDPRDAASYQVRENEPAQYSWVRLENLDDAQFTVEWEIVPGCVIRGHLDEIAQCFEAALLEDSFARVVGQRVVVEAKLLGPDYWKKWLKHGWAAFPGYATQVSVYGHATGLDVVFVVGQKVRVGGQDEEVHVEIPSAHVTWVPNEGLPVSIGALRLRVLKLKGMVERGELPDCDGVNTFGCPVRYLGCDEGAEKKDEVPRVDKGEELAGLVARLENAKRVSKSAKTVEDNAKKNLEAFIGGDEVKALTATTVFFGGDREVKWVVEERGESVVKAHTRRYPQIVKVKTSEIDNNEEQG